MRWSDIFAFLAALMAAKKSGGGNGNSGSSNGGGGGGGGGGNNGNDNGGGTPSPNGGCPAVWSSVSADLTASFVSGGQCTDLARGAIRYAFHDAGTWAKDLPTFSPASGGADGSLMICPSEIGRPENFGLQDYHTFVTNLWGKYRSKGVGGADLVYFAGNHAIVSCPLGPIVKTVVGRQDASPTQQSPQNEMPAGNGPGSDHDTLFKLFQRKGFDAVDLAALVGAHSTSKAVGQTAFNIPVNGSQDSTPGIWDVKFYGETYTPPRNVFRFQSDISLSAKNTAVGKEFNGFVNNQGKWNGKFADAMFRLSLLGIPSSVSSKFVDCTSMLPKSQSRRSVFTAPYNNRAR